MLRRMEAVEDVVRDAFARHERGEELVREVCEREGPSIVVKTVARLVAERAPRHGEAILFLSDGLELPALRSVIESDADLRSAFEEQLTSSDVRDRRTAIWALQTLPIADSVRLLSTAAERLLAEREVISLAMILEIVELPAVVERLAASDDWLLRWALLPWTNGPSDSRLVDRIRRQLAADSNLLVAGEASQHLEILDAFEKQVASAEGWTFGVTSNYGPATSFRSVTSRFVEQWPAEKIRYTLDELRVFITQSTEAHV